MPLGEMSFINLNPKPKAAFNNYSNDLYLCQALFIFTTTVSLMHAVGCSRLIFFIGHPAISPGEEDFGCHHANAAGHADSGGL